MVEDWWEKRGAEWKIGGEEGSRVEDSGREREQA
jgi:hypothetical protein